MEVKKPNQKYQSHYEDFCIGVKKLRETGGCTVITIPKKVMKEIGLKKGSHILVTLHKRTKKFHDELEGGEQWVKLNKRERIQFKYWLDNNYSSRDKENKKDDDMEETIDWNM